LRDKPSFDDVELPEVVTSRIDGMTDAEWAARRERSERRFRAVFGAVLGGFVGLGVGLRAASGSYLAGALIIGGCVLLFSALLSRSGHDPDLDRTAWMLFPEWYLLEKLPLGVIVCFWIAAFALAALLAVALVAGLLRH
jgi:hypothetical protein